MWNRICIVSVFDGLIVDPNAYRIPVMRIRLNYYTDTDPDPDPGFGNPPYKSGSGSGSRIRIQGKNLLTKFNFSKFCGKTDIEQQLYIK